MNQLVSSVGEFKLIERIRKWVPKNAYHVIQGIGDDAAVVRMARGGLALMTTDALVEGVDFSFASVSPQQVGRKALAVNLSDIAAMGGDPKYALIALTVPKKTKTRFVAEFYKGFLRLAKQLGVNIVGGDLSSGPCWMAAVTVMGETTGKHPIFRHGARRGDLICVTGDLGGSILGKHHSFLPRLEEGRFLTEFRVHSMIDISDGLVQDLEHVLVASRAGADLWLDRIPVSSAAKRLAKNSRGKALHHALSDGEDFELLVTVDKNRFPSLAFEWKTRFSTPLTAIGCVAGSEPKVNFVEKGRRVPFRLLKKGFSHF